MEFSPVPPLALTRPRRRVNYFPVRTTGAVSSDKREEALDLHKYLGLGIYAEVSNGHL